MKKNRRFIMHSVDFTSTPEFVRFAYKLKKQGVATCFGYVLFWRICEECRRMESATPADVLEILADDMGIPAETVPFIVKCVLESGLANETEKGILPQLVNDCLVEMEARKKQSSEAGKKSWEARQKQTEANESERPFNDRLTTVQRNRTNANEAEQTETKKETETKISFTSCPESFSTTAKPAAEVEYSEFSLTLNDGSEYRIPAADLVELKQLYPAANVEQELRNMRGWVLANPTKRKTKTGIKRFITSWLSRTQDKGGKPTTPSTGQTAQPRGAFVAPPASAYGSFYK